MILLIIVNNKYFMYFAKTKNRSYQEKLRDWPYDASATNELSGAKSSRQMPEDERDINLPCVKPSFIFERRLFYLLPDD